MFKKIIALSIITSLLMQFSLSMNLIDSVYWMFSFSGMITFLILFSLFSFSFYIFNSFKTLFFAFILIFIISTISFIKNKILGVPLLPWDLFALNESIMIVKVILEKNITILLFLTTFLTLIGFLLLKIPKNKEKQSFKKLFIGTGSFILLLIIILAQNPIHDYIFKERLNINKKTFSITENGLIINFIMLTEQGILIPPSNFSPEKSKQVLSQFENETQSNDFQRPDIIVVMSESFFDPMQLKNVKWKKDLLEFSRSLNKRNINLTKVPTYGGKTANSEFEFLTGNSMRFFGPGSTPYTTIKGKQESIIHSLNKVGYNSIAIHPGGKTAWNRDIIYENFGFKEFIHGDLFKKSELFGNFPSDHNIIPELEQSLEKNKDNPSFHFIVTLQNHMPYDVNPFDFSNLLFDDSNISNKDKVVLNYYSKLIKKTDDFHKDLISFLTKRNKPTVLLIFGDHLPSLSDDYSILKKYGMISNDFNENDKLKTQITPLITWSNMNQKFDFEETITNCNFIGISLLNKLNIPLTPYQNFVLKISKENPNFDIKKLDSFSMMKLIEQYHSLQYLMLSNKSDINNSHL